MANRRKAHLDALERRLTGPKRIALFGHRDVGKTTLLAMFYRQASTGQVPGVRLAAGDPASAEYLAEKIAQIESGEPPAGTLAETELKLRLYHGPARFDLIVKDYQGEHVTLGTDEPIQAFFADCDAVLLCLDPEGSTAPGRAAAAAAGGREPAGAVHRPLRRRHRRPARGAAADEVRPGACARGEAGQDDPTRVERLVEARYGMTRHALARHAPRGAIFAVSSYGRGAGDGRPPAELHPLGLEGPLGWLAEQLEAGDREQLEWLWDLAPDDLPRLARCVAAYERRYPRSDRAGEFRRRLAEARRRERPPGAGPARRWRRRWSPRRWRVTTPGAIATPLGLRAGRQPRAGRRPAVGRAARLAPVAPALLARPARGRPGAALAEWAVKAAEVQVANGTAAPDLAERLAALKDQAPSSPPPIRKVEDAAGPGPARRALDARSRPRPPPPPTSPSRRWRPSAASSASSPRPPTGPRPSPCSTRSEARADARRPAASGRSSTTWPAPSGLPNADLRDLIDQARQFLAEHPESRLAGRGRAPARRLRQDRSTTATSTGPASTRSSTRPNFATRIERYRTTSRPTPGGGRYISEATEAKDRVLREWDTYTYRQAYDHLAAHPDDVAEVARRLRDYLHDHRDGRYARDAQALPRLVGQGLRPRRLPRDPPPRRGRARASASTSAAAPRPRRRRSRSAASPTAPRRSSATPTGRSGTTPSPGPIRWKLGDPVTIRVVDYDWSDSTVVILNSPQGRPPGHPQPLRHHQARQGRARPPWSSPPTSRCPSCSAG